MAELYFSLLNLLILLYVGSVITTKTVHSQNPKDYFEISPLNVSVNEGEPVILDCTVRSSVRHCIWKRDGKITVQPGITNKYSKIGHSENDCSMRIEHPTLANDNGQWMCIITLKDDGKEIKAGAYVTVIKAPQSLQVLKGNQTINLSMNSPLSVGEDASNRLLANVTLSAGQNMSEIISCVSTRSNPPAKIVWMKDYDLISAFEKIEIDPPGKNTFSVTSYPNFMVSFDYHRATIRCQADHLAYERKQEVHFRLFVEHPTTTVDMWISGRSGKEITVHLGRPEAIECRANGYPSPSYAWERINSRGEAERIDGNSTLLVGSTITEDGIYRCLAGNSMNEEKIGSNQNITIKIEYPTNNVTVQSDRPTVVHEGGAIHLECQANGFPPPQIRWLKKYGDGWFHIAGGKLFIINNFTTEDQGHYHCSAFNVHNNKDVESLPVHLHLSGSEDRDSNSAITRHHSLRPLYIYVINVILCACVQLC